MGVESVDDVAARLAEAGYAGLFLYGDRGQAESIWRDGANRARLEQIVRGDRFPDLTRLLASELLYAKAPGYPPDGWGETLARLYAYALATTGDNAGTAPLSGNQWGFMYYTDQLGVADYGPLGAHLLAAERAAIPHLAPLLDDTDAIVYEGSRDATTGNNLAYRVKDAAAYYIGKLAGIPVRFHEQPADRDAEIERLKAALQGGR
jgi:hypothetical protein